MNACPVRSVGRWTWCESRASARAGTFAEGDSLRALALPYYMRWGLSCVAATLLVAGRLPYLILKTMRGRPPPAA